MGRFGAFSITSATWSPAAQVRLMLARLPAAVAYRVRSPDQHWQFDVDHLPVLDSSMAGSVGPIPLRPPPPIMLECILNPPIMLDGAPEAPRGHPLEHDRRDQEAGCNTSDTLLS